MNDASLLPKRIRRCEVSDLVFAEELAEVRSSLRAIYEAILLICRRLPESALGSAPADVLMLPPWHENPQTGNVLPPPRGLAIEQAGLGAYRMKLSLLAAEELAAVHSAQTRLCEHREALLKRESARAATLKKTGPVL